MESEAQGSPGICLQSAPPSPPICPQRGAPPLPSHRLCLGAPSGPKPACPPWARERFPELKGLPDGGCDGGCLGRAQFRRPPLAVALALEPKCLGSNPSSVTSGRLLNLSVPQCTCQWGDDGLSSQDPCGPRQAHKGECQAASPMSGLDQLKTPSQLNSQEPAKDPQVS